jgi:hypothetical protein
VVVVGAGEPDRRRRFGAPDLAAPAMVVCPAGFSSPAAVTDPVWGAPVGGDVPWDLTRVTPLAGWLGRPPSCRLPLVPLLRSLRAAAGAGRPAGHDGGGEAVSPPSLWRHRCSWLAVQLGHSTWRATGGAVTAASAPACARASAGGSSEAPSLPARLLLLHDGHLVAVVGAHPGVGGAVLVYIVPSPHGLGCCHHGRRGGGGLGVSRGAGSGALSQIRCSQDWGQCPTW